MNGAEVAWAFVLKRVCFFGLGLLGITNMAVQASEVPQKTNGSESKVLLVQEQVSVRELMRLETALALSDARQALRHSQTRHARQAGRIRAPGQGPYQRLELPDTNVRLKSIYGVGKKLVARIQVGDRQLTYINGRPRPVGATSGESVYLLKSIEGQCVTLQRKQVQQRVCFDTSGAGTP